VIHGLPPIHPHARILAARNILDAISDRRAKYQPSGVNSQLSLVQWTAQHAPEDFRALQHALELPANSSPTLVNAALYQQQADTDNTSALLSMLKSGLGFLNIGRLYLERLHFTPLDPVPGDLVHSLALAPNESVRISHRVWSTTSKEFETIVTDSFEDYSEKGVNEKTDLSQATESQANHEVGRSLQANASATYGIVSVSTNGALNLKDDEKNSQKVSKNESVSLTSKASSRAKKDYKTSFKVVTTSGTEDTSAQLIVNPNPTRSLRVDYYQLLKEWRVDLYRYGLRMGFDIVVPNPGAELYAIVQEIKELTAFLREAFVFPVKVEDIQPDPASYQRYIDQYGVEDISPPPDPIVPKTFTKDIGSYPDSHDSDTTRIDVFTFDLDEGYMAKSLEVESAFVAHNDITQSFDILEDTPISAWNDGAKIPYKSNLPFLEKVSGHASLVYRFRGIAHGILYLRLLQVPLESTIQKWRLATWSSIRQAAIAAFQQAQQNAAQRLAFLNDKVANTDPLTLREREHEAIVKTTIAWLLGPGFQYQPALYRGLMEHQPFGFVDGKVLDPCLLTSQQWQSFLDYGNLVKFLHQAFEWESLVYFLYPYFWDDRTIWPDKRFLDHPDSMHRKFLRAGSAHVVVTAKPGFEVALATVIANHTFASPPDASHPYLQIAREIQDASSGDMFSDNPSSEGDGEEPGKLIGTWSEFVPTEALDVRATEIANLGQPT
jgi:hypothetical protein